MKIWMKFKKATPNTFVFEECDEMGQPIENMLCKIPSLYIRKSATKEPMQHITVEITPGLISDAKEGV